MAFEKTLLMSDIGEGADRIGSNTHPQLLNLVRRGRVPEKKECRKPEEDDYYSRRKNGSFSFYLRALILLLF
jgi:hypothetical protein